MVLMCPGIDRRKGGRRTRERRVHLSRNLARRDFETADGVFLGGRRDKRQLTERGTRQLTMAMSFLGCGPGVDDALQQSQIRVVGRRAPRTFFVQTSSTCCFVPLS